jgi:beta-glucosidase
LIVAKGCDVENTIPGGYDQAVAAARAADVVLLAVGESQNMSGEAQSRTEIGLPRVQQQLAELVGAGQADGRAAAPRPRPGAGGRGQGAPACWPPGSWAARPARRGRRAVRQGQSVGPPAGQLPARERPGAVRYNHRTTGRPAPQADDSQEYKARWRTTRNEALYPFGHGLSYTSFALSDVRLSTTRLAWNDKLHITATVANTGKVAGEHVVQLYVRDRVASRTRPVREMKGFQRISLAPGAEREIRFELKRDQLMFVGDNDYWIVEPPIRTVIGRSRSWIYPCLIRL